ncbi:MAG: ComEC/Rec2 family competence protein [Pseudomonadota bacterium]
MPNYPIRLVHSVSNTYHDTKGTFIHALNWELDRGLAFNIAPVFLAIGIIIYFTLPAEPLFLALVITFCCLFAAAIRIEYHGKLFFLVAGLTLVLAGMSAAKLSVMRSATPQIERQMTAVVSGVVLLIDQNRRGSPRMVLRPVKIGGLSQQQLPNKIRLSTTSREQGFKTGMQVEGLARLQPVSGPVYPGSYDFSFHSWFSGLGGSGFFMGAPAIVTQHPTLDVTEQIAVTVNGIRDLIEQRIVDAIPGAGGDVAVALITGDKSRIPEDVQQSLRNTGLAHILAISGLHMALVTLTIISSLRFVFSLSPRLVLNYPVKKWAACGGFLGATLYLFLSGGGIAKQRAWILISVMLLAVLLDKRAITMRSVAVSACIILLISPESLFAPGFQMSFAAVASLVAGYEFLTKRRREQAENRFSPARLNWVSKLTSGLFGYVSGLATTSLIAGMATAFVAAWHFHQVAPLGLLANMLAMPIVGFVIMPFALFSMLLMPYGLEVLALWPVAYGIGWVVDIAQWVDGLSSVGVTGALPITSLALFGCFLSVLTLFRTRLRLWSFLPVFMVVPFLARPEVPHILISENGRAIAVKTENNQLALLYPRRNAFVTEIWGKAFSGGNTESLNLPKDQCNSERCIVVLPSSDVLHVVYNPDLLRSSCQRADILVAPRLWWVDCRERKPELVLKRYDFEQYGSHAIFIAAQPGMTRQSEGVRVVAGLPKSTRPWSRNVRPIDEISDTDE